MGKIKVGIDECVVVDAQDNQLMTDGLTGCVAVGLSQGGKIALAHVYSECNEGNWASYRDNLRKTFDDAGIDMSKAQTILVCSQGFQGKGSDAWLPNQLKSWLEKETAGVHTEKSGGCCLSATQEGLQYMTKTSHNGKFFDEGYATSTELGPELKAHGRLSGYGSAASLAPLPDEAYHYSGPLLTQSEHPAHGLYQALKAKAPPDLGDYGNEDKILSGLTVRALRGGITDVAAVDYGKPPYDNRLFVMQETAYGQPKGAFVEMAQAEMREMRPHSYEAMAMAKQLEAPPLASAHAPPQPEQQQGKHQQHF